MSQSEAETSISESCRPQHQQHTNVSSCSTQLSKVNSQYVWVSKSFSYLEIYVGYVLYALLWDISADVTSLLLKIILKSHTIKRIKKRWSSYFLVEFCRAAVPNRQSIMNLALKSLRSNLHSCYRDHRKWGLGDRSILQYYFSFERIPFCLTTKSTGRTEPCLKTTLEDQHKIWPPWSTQEMPLHTK